MIEDVRSEARENRGRAARFGEASAIRAWCTSEIDLPELPRSRVARRNTAKPSPQAFPGFAEPTRSEGLTVPPHRYSRTARSCLS